MTHTTWQRIVFICILFSPFISLAQTTDPVFENGHYTYLDKTEAISDAIQASDVTSATPLSLSFTRDISLPAELTVSQRKILSAFLHVKLNLGDNYTFGPAVSTTNSPLDFKFKVSFELKAFNGANAVNEVFDQPAYELVIENSRPEAVLIKNFSSFSDLPNNNVSASDFLFQRFSIENVTITPLTTAASAASVQAEMLAKIANTMRFEISYDIEYGINVQNEPAPVITSLSYEKQLSKQVTFVWYNQGREYPNYEFQLLRLFNVSPSTATIEEDITADIDWSKALKIETQSSETQLTLTIAEGTGFYVWRVRPIGSFFAGGISNDLNYSENGWSPAPTNGNGYTLTFYDGSGVNGGGSDYPFFYYQDPTQDKNWIYSRTFSENNKTSEILTFATPLQQVRQTQTYRASKDSVLVTQSIVDHIGRPALSTLPVPVPGKLGEYKEKFVQKEGTDELYTAKDFDEVTNFRDPARVNQDGTPLSYYSNQNPNLAIPNAEGYPFQRTIYQNDGTQRVMEQSGVGKTHMIGDGSSDSGGGKTSKTYYSTPSESELVALFGDEAPDHESVLKTISVDPNNTASISYTSKEGNVIATGLSFQDSNDVALEPLDQQPASSFVQTVKDAITRNVSTERGFKSSKRIVLLKSSPMDISYKVKCQELQNNCLDLSLDCKYKVKVVIHNIDNPSATIVLPEKALGNADVPCTADASGVEYKQVSWPQQMLAPGTYIVEKLLIAGDAQVVVDDARTKAERQIMPLINKITGWLNGIDCEAELTQFYADLNGLKNDVNNAYKTGTVCDAACVVNKWALGDFLLKPEHKIDLFVNAAGTPQRLEISSPCCGVMSVPVVYIPPFRCPAEVKQVDVNGNGRFDVNVNYFTNPAATEFFPDFEGYALAILKECNLAETTFYSKYMVGWAKGEFNKMVYLMLTDQYKGGDPAVSASNNTTTNEVDDCGNPIVNSGIKCTGDNCTQYTCSQLIDCWTQQIITLRNALCANGEYISETPANVSNRTDEDSGEEVGQGKTHDNHFNDAFDDVKMRRRKKKKLKKKMAKAMRELSANTATASEQQFTGYVVKDFLDCTGYAFAKILTSEDPKPLPEDVNNTLRYNVPFTNGGATTTPCPGGVCKTMPYTPSTTWPNTVVIPAASGTPAKLIKDYFPNVKHHLYAWKYFEYPDALRVREVEVSTCYVDPNDCYKTNASGQIILGSNGKPIKIPCCFQKNSDGTYSPSPLCDASVSTPDGKGNFSSANNTVYDLRYNVKDFCDQGKLICPYTSEGWNNGQRYSFYTLIKNFVPQDIEEEDNPLITETCEDYTVSSMGVYNEETNPIGLLPEEVMNWKEWNNMAPADPLPVNQYPTVVQYEMKEMSKRCEGKCDSRREEFRSKLQKSFAANGYIIGACKASPVDNVVPDEDIELLVDQIIAQCKLQCPITTYSCQTVYCRDVMTPATQVGHTKTSVDVEYGTGTCGGVAKCEQRKWRQVMTWDFEIDMPNMRDLDGDLIPDGTRKFSCVPSPNMADYSAVYDVFTNAPVDANHFKPLKTVSPAVEINLSLPEKN